MEPTLPGLPRSPTSANTPCRAPPGEGLAGEGLAGGTGDAEGCLFDTAYTPSPVCMPARASLASGLYPHAHGFFSNYTGQQFPAHQVTLFHCLQQVGYITAKIGKYHYFSLEWGQDYEDYRHYYNQLGLDWAEEISTPFQGPFIK